MMCYIYGVAGVEPEAKDHEADALTTRQTPLSAFKVTSIFKNLNFFRRDETSCSSTPILIHCTAFIL